MTDRAARIEMMKQVEALLDSHGGHPPDRIKATLYTLGFSQQGGDPAVVVLEHPGLELHLEIELDEEGMVHSYVLLPFDEKERKQEKFRW